MITSRLLRLLVSDITKTPKSFGPVLGPELFTASVIANPELVNPAWSYLGGTSWQLNGNGSNQELIFLRWWNQPAKFRLEFTVDSISGGGLTTAGSLGPTVNSPGDYIFDLDNSVIEFGQQFKRSSGAVTAVISEMSMREIL